MESPPPFASKCWHAPHLRSPLLLQNHSHEHKFPHAYTHANLYRRAQYFVTSCFVTVRIIKMSISPRRFAHFYNRCHMFETNGLGCHTIAFERHRCGCYLIAYQHTCFGVSSPRVCFFTAQHYKNVCFASTVCTPL